MLMTLPVSRTNVNFGVFQSFSETVAGSALWTSKRINIPMLIACKLPVNAIKELV